MLRFSAIAPPHVASYPGPSLPLTPPLLPPPPLSPSPSSFHSYLSVEWSHSLAQGCQERTSTRSQAPPQHWKGAGQRPRQGTVANTHTPSTHHGDYPNEIHMGNCGSLIVFIDHQTQRLGIACMHCAPTVVKDRRLHFASEWVRMLQFWGRCLCGNYEYRYNSNLWAHWRVCMHKDLY